MNWITDDLQGAVFGGGKSVRKIGKTSTLEEIDDHRYTLWRRFEEGAPLSEMVAFIGLNPSTATPEKLDNTVRKCEHYAREWGYKGFVMLNLFSYRATSPAEMMKYEHESPSYATHVKNGEAIYYICSRAKLTVCCWGNGGKFISIGAATVEGLIRKGVTPYCIGKNKTGEPLHPCYAKKDLEPLPY